MIQRSREEKIRKLKKLKQELNGRTSYGKNRQYKKRIRPLEVNRNRKILINADLYER